MSVIGQRIKQSEESGLIFNAAKVAEWAKNRQVVGTVTLPEKRLTDSDYDYVPACKTDLRETFRKAREEQRKSMVIHREFNNAKAN